MDYEKTFEEFVKLCKSGPHGDALTAPYEALKNLPPVALEARCRLTAGEAVGVRDLLLVCGAYLSAATEHEREMLSEALGLQAARLCDNMQ